MKKGIYFIWIGIVVFITGMPTIIRSQEKQVLRFNQYLENVKNSNIDYIVAKYSVDIANANTEAAKVFPDPELTLGGTDNQEHKLKMGYSLDAGLDYTLELGNKRKARIRLAQSEAELTTVLLKDYFRNLRADATLAYLSVLKQKQLVEIQQSSYNQMRRLSYADSVRFKLGSIMEIDARQSKLEADAMLSEVLQGEADLYENLLQLSLYQGDKQVQLPDSVAGSLTYIKREFDILTLMTLALENRADLQAALKSKDVSQRTLNLAKANRAIDLGLSIGISRNAEVRNEIAPAPAFTSISAGISIPLKFSNINKSGVKAAELALQQSEASYDAIEMQILSDIKQTYYKYSIACRQVEQYNTGLLADAKLIFDKKVYGYERGETDLIEVLNAQRTYNDIRVSYNDILYNCAVALIELERTCGIWDINIAE